jgi:hypothetical protein
VEYGIWVPTLDSENYSIKKIKENNAILFLEEIYFFSELLILLTSYIFKNTTQCILFINTKHINRDYKMWSFSLYGLWEFFSFCLAKSIKILFKFG